MSLVLDDITPYFVNSIKTLGLFTHANKPFDQSIPSTVIDRSFSVFFERISGVNRNMIDFQMIASIYILLYRKGYQYEDKAREEAVKDSEMILKACMKVNVANKQQAIKNVTMRTIDIQSFPNNDNTIVSRINFDVNIRMNPNL